ncbi:MAG: RNA 2',3'-cyclic phosphodiesterase, partial [Candidatus Eremiobacteraeota bacterium]|nr:RNA 2',3'-cyclic phosphodiesterase [Candidatus Eremiobacteraeota bacterium]
MKPDTTGMAVAPVRRRLFVAATIDQAARETGAFAAAALKRCGIRGRYVDPANYHVTVAFLGSIGAPRIAHIVARLHEMAAHTKPLQISFEVVGSFPNRRRPRVVWMGSRHPNPRFAALCATVRAALSPLGFSLDERDAAHVTLLRCERDSEPLPAIDLPGRVVEVAALTLFESRVSREGARYAP